MNNMKQKRKKTKMILKEKTVPAPLTMSKPTQYFIVTYLSFRHSETT